MDVSAEEEVQEIFEEAIDEIVDEEKRAKHGKPVKI